MRGIDRSQRGASAVEFAILAPLFVALLFAIIEFGMILYTKSMLAHASREGARFGVIYSNPRHTSGEIQTVVRNFLNTSGLTNAAAVNVTGAGGASEATLTVAVTYNYQFLVLPQDMNRFMGGTMPLTLNLAASTAMRME